MATDLPLAERITTAMTPPSPPEAPMKILIVSTSVFVLPIQGYGGTEALVYSLAHAYAKRGHEVTVVAPEGSTFEDPNIKLCPIMQGELEESAFVKYRDTLKDYDIIQDMAFGGWAYLESVGVEPPLPIIKTFHTDPSIWDSPPPVPHPCLIGISHDHSRRLALKLGVPVRTVYNGIPPDFYKPDPEKKRNGRLLWVGRYTPEKSPLDSMLIAKKLKMPLDCYGDTSMVASPEYVDRCRKEADGLLVRFYPGVSRTRTVELYQSYKALLYTPSWSEPFGLVLCEASACGLPIVTLGHGSLPELVKNGVNGFSCDTIEQVEDVLRSGKLRDIRPEACREWALQFSVDSMAERYLALFREIQAGHTW